MAKLILKNLRKQFMSKSIPVKDVSVKVEEGEFLTLLGPSGCGKSTLLRMIAGLDRPTEGRVILGGEDITLLPPGQRNMAMVFQSYALYPHMTVFDNISTALRLRKVDQNEIKTRVKSVSKRLGLEYLLDRKPGQLSGGQRQRVALARSLVRNPDVFLLDEPLSNLDALLREQVRADLKQLFAAQQKPVVYVTHDQTEAMTLSSKIAVLYEGFVQQLGTPKEIYRQPANQFVAGFVGSPQMNLLTLTCEQNQAILGNFALPLPALSRVPRAIAFGIRPEDIRIAPEDSKEAVEGTVYLVEDLGKERLLSVRIAGSDKTLRSLIPADQPFSMERVRLRLPQKAMHWFDVDAGDRLHQ